MSAQPPPQLLHEAAAGHRPARERLFRAHADYAFAVAYRYLGNRYDAADVAHEAWLRVFAGLGRYDAAKGAFRSWLARVVANEALAWLRRERVRETRDLPVAGPDTPRGINRGPSQLGVAEIAAALQQLPERARLVVNLVVFEGYTHHEVAEQLSIAVSASRSQLSRGKAQLRDILSRQNPDR